VRLSILLAVSAALVGVQDDRLAIAQRVTKLTRASLWTQVSAVPVGFRTYHPQGMVKIGNTIVFSSVDRAGTGHLFKMDLKGKLLADVTIGEGAIYHPGGIDYDGKFIWVPVAEYRPDSRAIIYRVDPATLKATEVFRVDDHIGAIVHNTDDETLHGVSWGSRRFYRWTMDGRSAARTLNPSHYIDYQDCKYAGARQMLCGGLTEMRQTPEATPFRLGGIDLIDLRDGRPVHQVPILLWTKSGLDMTHNPLWLEPSDRALRAYFMPEDDTSTLYIFEVEL
jgi:uncharacterized protein DUF6454